MKLGEEVKSAGYCGIDHEASIVVRTIINSRGVIAVRARYTNRDEFHRFYCGVSAAHTHRGFLSGEKQRKTTV